MKVKGTGSAGSVGKTGKSKGASATSGASGASFGSVLAAQEVASAGAAGESATAQAIGGIDVLLMVQAAEDSTQGGAQQRMKRRSVKILDALDALRDKMLGNQLTVADMIGLADVVASHRETIDDPALAALMDEIDLRAQVEIAKVQVAIDRRRF